MFSSSQQKQLKAPWIPISTSLSFMFKEKKVLLWSMILSLCTVVITWLSFSFATTYVDGLSTGLFEVAEASGSWWTTVKSWLLSGLSLFYLIGTRIICFYLSFLVAYTLTSPGYFFLSHAAEKIYSGQHFDPDAAFTLKGALIDLWEGIKIGLMGVVVTIFGFALNFIPIIGQILLILTYTVYSALIFVDYPASRRRWSLGKKVSWLKNNKFTGLRIGVLPALISLVPVLNIFGMALIFPLMTVHATLNFSNIEIFRKTQTK